MSRYTTSLITLVPTHWGPPTFEIDGIKMLPTAQTSPYTDAERKVALIQPHGKVILDTCGDLGYFAAWCVQGLSKHVLSYEKNPDVVWLRGHPDIQYAVNGPCSHG
jgi:predicted methyltransferase